MRTSRRPATARTLVHAPDVPVPAGHLSQEDAFIPNTLRQRLSLSDCPCSGRRKQGRTDPACARPRIPPRTEFLKSVSVGLEVQSSDGTERRAPCLSFRYPPSLQPADYPKKCAENDSGDSHFRHARQQIFGNRPDFTAAVPVEKKHPSGSSDGWVQKTGFDLSERGLKQTGLPASQYTEYCLKATAEQLSAGCSGTQFQIIISFFQERHDKGQLSECVLSNHLNPRFCSAQ